MFTLVGLLKTRTGSHGTAALGEHANFNRLLLDALDQWHEDDEEPRLKYVVDGSDDQVQCTLLGARGSNFVTVSFRDGSSLRYRVAQVVHDGKVIHQSVQDVTGIKGAMEFVSDAEVHRKAVGRG